MTRFLYQCLLLLHPAAFRDRFGGEMLWIFDELAGSDRSHLFGDGLISLGRQWLFRSRAWNFAVGALLSFLMLFGFSNLLRVSMGEVRSYWLGSAALGGQRIVCVYTPPDYDPDAMGGYRLLVLSDGVSYGNWFQAVNMLDELIRSGTLPPLISVWVDDHSSDLKSDTYSDASSVEFLADKLLPWLHERLNITSDPQKTIIGTTGRGAATVFAAMERPDLFGNVLSQSSSFWDWHDDAIWESLTTQSEADPTRSVRFFIEARLPEDAVPDGAALIEANRQFPKVLKSQGYRVVDDEVGGTSEPVRWEETLPQGLMALMR